MCALKPGNRAPTAPSVLAHSDTCAPTKSVCSTAPAVHRPARCTGIARTPSSAVAPLARALQRGSDTSQKPVQTRQTPWFWQSQANALARDKDEHALEPHGAAAGSA